MKFTEKDNAWVVESSNELVLSKNDCAFEIATPVGEFGLTIMNFNIQFVNGGFKNKLASTIMAIKFIWKL